MRIKHRQLLILLVLVPMLGACGFHLRQDDYRLPQEWMQLGIEARGKVSSNSGLVLQLQQQLRETQGATVQVGAAVSPRIVLYSEQFRNPVSALDSLGRAREYLIEYIVQYQLVDTTGKELLPKKQRIYLRREQSYSSTQILAKERESEYLKKELQRHAAERIVDRLLAVLHQTPVDRG